MGIIVECGINFLSYGRVADLVPPEFLVAYDWFQSMEGEFIPRLPRGADAPSIGASIKLAAMRGIHSPNYKELVSKGAGKKKYALSVYSAAQKSAAASVNTFYSDQDLVERDDGTWIMEYCEQKTKEGRRATDKSNSNLMNNLADGVPVAVMAGQSAGGYVICGLAYVERYDPSTGMFTLHGPVSAEGRGVNFYSEISYDDLTPEEKELLRQADGLDERARVFVVHITFQ